MHESFFFLFMKQHKNCMHGKCRVFLQEAEKYYDIHYIHMVYIHEFHLFHKIHGREAIHKATCSEFSPKIFFTL